MRPPLVCERIRAQVSLQLDDGLSELERRMLESHLVRCAECRAYAASVSSFTEALRAAPLEPLERSIELPRRRRSATARLQVGAAAAMALVALGVTTQITASEPRGSSFSILTQYPSQAQLDRELAIFDQLPERSVRGPAGGVVL